MPDEKKLPQSEVSKGVVLPLAGSRNVNFAERAQQPRPPEKEKADRPTKLPPRPGRLPDCGPIDPRLILNRDDSEE
jgi:hypothetical protein